MKFSVKNWHYKFNEMTEKSYLKFFKVNYWNFCSYCWGTLGNFVLVGIYTLLFCSVAVGTPESIAFIISGQDFYQDVSTYAIVLQVVVVLGSVISTVLIFSTIVLLILFGVGYPTYFLYDIISHNQASDNVREAWKAYKDKYCPVIEWEKE